MGHPDSGQIQALLDGEVIGPEAEALRAHLGDCPECGVAAQGQEEAFQRASQALLILDTEPDVNRVREGIRARMKDIPGKKAPSRLRWLYPISLPKAASIALILTGVVATSLPGSPVRSWMVDGWRAVFGSSQAAEEGTRAPGNQDAPSLEGEELAAGASVTAGAESVELWVYDLPAQAQLQVVWVDEGEAWIRAGEGTRFIRGTNRLEAHSPPGPVRVEIPRSLRSVLVGVDGNVLLRKSGEDVELLGPVSTRGPSEVVFGPVGPPNEDQR